MGAFANDSVRVAVFTSGDSFQDIYATFWGYSAHGNVNPTIGGLIMEMRFSF